MGGAHCSVRPDATWSTTRLRQGRGTKDPKEPSLLSSKSDEKRGESKLTNIKKKFDLELNEPSMNRREVQRRQRAGRGTGSFVGVAVGDAGAVQNEHWTDNRRSSNRTYNLF